MIGALRFGSSTPLGRSSDSGGGGNFFMLAGPHYCYQHRSARSHPICGCRIAKSRLVRLLGHCCTPARVICRVVVIQL